MEFACGKEANDSLEARVQTVVDRIIVSQKVYILLVTISDISYFTWQRETEVTYAIEVADQLTLR